MLHFTRATTPGSSVIEVGRGITVGRTPEECDVATGDPAMSACHARIGPQGTEWFLHDLHSLNGCFVDGMRLARGGAAAIGYDSVIRFGDTLAVFTVEEDERDENSESPDFPGVSSRAAQVRRQIHRWANGSGHVLILGETGTGKERVARAIGATVRTFVPINCAELSRQLARSELFGHVRGAFTGATAVHTGLVEVANGGALFLDELGELPLDVQAELLRFLEDGQYRPVGSTELRRSTARVIAATNVDLDQAVDNGTFRRDLLGRLRNTRTALQLPALRDRRADIHYWSVRFLGEAVGEVPGTPWSPGALECLLLYPWPENLRELRGVVRTAWEASCKWPIPADALPDNLQEHRRVRRSSNHANPTDDAPTGNASTREAPAREAPTREAPTREAPTREAIEAVLRRVRGNMRQAAQELHTDRTELYRRCRALGILYQTFRQENDNG